MISERVALTETIDSLDGFPNQLQAEGPGHTLESNNYNFIGESTASFRYRLAKRTFDVTLAAILIVVLMPICIAVALAVKYTSPGGVVFKQYRQGLHGREFQILKFRSMVQQADLVLLKNSELGAEFQKTYKLRVDPRVTKVGRFIRKTSLDELPQLINILQGDMSFVGPRPIPAQEMDYQYGSHKHTVLSVHPGLTGLWQISGRSSLTYEQRVEIDVAYVRNTSFWRDMHIILMTIPALLGSKDAC